MFWYWKVRIYNSEGMYAITFVKTNRVLAEIDAIQDFYFEQTGCKMLLEGMADNPPVDEHLGFSAIWRSN